jgi:UDP-N-acetylmuramoyl-L-alanyl-D-glutamate--2,6-diaminopimelate ligase
MVLKKLSELIAALPDVVSINGDADVTASIVEDNHEVQPGGVFVARVGLSADGHDFIQAAIQRGAAAIVGERDIRDLPVPYVRVKNAQEVVGYLAAAYHDYPSRKMIVIGVTGTDGKTTTCTLIHSILQVATGGGAGLISTVAAYIGDQIMDTGFHVTTPGAPQIQAFLAQMVKQGLTHCVIEMTSHGLAQGRLNGIDLDVAVLTNLTHEHLDYHGSFEAYRAAKGRMFEMLGKSYKKSSYEQKTSIINADDPNAAFFERISNLNGAVSWKYGLEMRDEYYQLPSRYFYVDNPKYNPSEIECDIIRYKESSGGMGWGHVRSGLIGEFNLRNMLAAAAAANALAGVNYSHVEKGIASVRAIPGRMERINEGQNYMAIVDFAHTPNALENALKAGRQMLQPGQRLIAVFGSAGLRDREKRRLMAEVSAQLADCTILTAEDPRTEALDDILETMAQACISKGGVEGKTFVRVPDRGAALYCACQTAQPGDMVIACGKGHEQSMCFGTIEYPWDDREALRAAIRGRPIRTLPTAM